MSDIPAEDLARVRAALKRELAAGKLEIPLLPDVAVNILSNPLNDNTNINALSELIHRDQTLAAHVLKVVNSPAFMGEQRVVSLKQAVMRLGLSNLRELVLAVAFQSRLFDIPRFEVFLQETWQFSAATAAYAREVAELCGLDRESGFLCGLLHNVGKPALLMKLIDLHREIPPGADSLALLEACPDLQIQAGGIIGDKWALPLEVKNAIAYQNRWDEPQEHATHAKVTALSKTLTDNVFVAKLDEQSACELPVCKALGLTQEKIAFLLAKRDEVAAFAESFG